MVMPRGFNKPVATMVHSARAPDGLALGLALSVASELGTADWLEAELLGRALKAGRLAPTGDGLDVVLLHAAAARAKAASPANAGRAPIVSGCERENMSKLLLLSTHSARPNLNVALERTGLSLAEPFRMAVRGSQDRIAEETIDLTSIAVAT